ncbi:ABC transporter permease [Dyella subtropica]|uniref:ABC transporter permease n=1 Tax=Dyella subtropica TaxID=2992127 RepID=UPI002257D628|nr:FtsX-like permease family protein [Dyella subtropica]
MQIQPIFAALRRHRLAVLLIGMEIALACAVLCNACFLIAGRLQQIHIVSGVDEASLALIRMAGFADDAAVDLNARVVAGLRAIPGVQSVSVINAVPFSEHAITMGITLDPAKPGSGGVVHIYMGGQGSLEALGVKLVAGRMPQQEDYQPLTNVLPHGAQVLVTRALAEHLWPGENPLGREFLTGSDHFRVMGVLEHLIRPEAWGWGAGKEEWSVFAPVQPGKYLAGRYLLRADPAELNRVLRDARAAVVAIAPDAVLDTVNSRSVSDLRETNFRQDRAMTGMLLGVIFALLLVTAMGIVGLASFWVQQRRKQIGIRRAMGATRGDILSYFQTENFLIVSGGIALGMAMAFALNLALMKFYELPRLPLFYLPIGALMLWLLGQLAVLGPALRAAAVPPVVATRSV